MNADQQPAHRQPADQPSDRRPSPRRPAGRRRARHRQGSTLPSLATIISAALFVVFVAAGAAVVALHPLSHESASPGATPTQPEEAAAAGGAATSTGPPSAARHPLVTPVTSAPTTKPAATAPVPTQRRSTSTGSAPASSVSDAPGTLSRQEQQVVDLTNAAREQHGCRPLAVDPRLARAAHQHAQDMVERHYFSHVTPEGLDPSARARAAGFPAGAGENIAIGYTSAAAVMDGWLGSRGHRANILDCDYTVIGVGFDPGTVLTGYAAGSWVQMFGTL